MSSRIRASLLLPAMAGWLLLSCPALAAVGCTLNNPDRDIIRIFPAATNYRTEFISIQDRGGAILAAKIEKKLGDRLDPHYESLDVPYAYYTVLQGGKTIGYVHGVNQKGTYGGLQLILATDPQGVIRNFYYQKISSPEARLFRDRHFTSQFLGLTLADFFQDRAAAIIRDPSTASSADFAATMRGIMKNLILLDEFKLQHIHDQKAKTSQPATGGRHE
ncbi:MAG: hypothetical protein JXO49_11985 [Deltaproteobacteria bacterium]|nr:hypothetical protein [Candidatus Anaeroferrophillus wilburensis]MBN2890053.1 hypothetical protein [Deltaproteobacteria bacterium]